jgi:adenylate cyclase
MSVEIERKFLVCGNAWEELATSRVRIRQAYLSSDAKSSIRVRIRDDSVATLSVKSRPVGLRRLELEYDIPMLEADALIGLRQGSIITKTRHVIPWGDLAWEIDVFSGENQGLIIAEIELRYEHERFELPDWIGAEVTGQAQYYNSFLVRRPLCSWSHQDMDTPVGRRA